MRYTSPFPSGSDLSTIEARINSVSVDFNYVDELIEISETDFVEGGILEVSANTEQLGQPVFKLDFAPRDSVIEVNTSRSNCTEADFTFISTKEITSDCPIFGEDITIAYVYKEKSINRFELRDIDPDSILEIYVYLDGTLLKGDYQLEGNFIKISENLDDYNIVRIEVISYKAPE